MGCVSLILMMCCILLDMVCLVFGWCCCSWVFMCCMVVVVMGGCVFCLFWLIMVEWWKVCIWLLVSMGWI